MKTRRTSFTLPAPLYSDISYVASRLGVSQSALLIQVISEPLSFMASTLKTIPPSETSNPDAVRRFRGESVDFVNHAYTDLMTQLDSLPGVNHE